MKKIKDPALFEKIRKFLTEDMPVLRKKSPNTVEAYRYTLNIYLVFLCEKHSKSLYNITVYPDMERPSLYFLKFFCSVLFDTTSRTVGRLNEPAPGSAHRESNPSEDLSELPPLLVAVAGQDVPL